MSGIVVFDLEGDGLYDTVTRMWCGVFKNHDTEEVKRFYSLEVGSMIYYFKWLARNGYVIAGHNIIDYDLPALTKCYGYVHQGKIIDTLIMSRLSQPDRVGGHSIEAWGERFGVKKPEHEDWSKCTEDMLHRCTEDVRINGLVLSSLAEEMGLQSTSDIMECSAVYEGLK